MTRRRVLDAAALAFTAGLLTACGESNLHADAPSQPGEVTHRDIQVSHAPCNVDGSDAQKINVGGDSRPDIVIVRSGGREVCRSVDMNFDGIVDSWIYRDANGAVSRRENDYDRDGRIDEIQIYQNGVLVEKERATTLVGRLDTWHFYQGGKLARTERDSDGDTQIDQWWEYPKPDQPECPLIHSDVDGDGHPDPGATVNVCDQSSGYVPPERASEKAPSGATFETTNPRDVREVDSERRADRGRAEAGGRKPRNEEVMFGSRKLVLPFVALSAVALLSGCGGSNTETTAAKAPSQVAAGGNDQSRCDYKGRADREVVESNGPGATVPNVRRVFGILGEGEDRRRVLFCREIDTNLDGVKDVVRMYNDKGDPVDEQADTDYDGKIDTWIKFSGGRIAKEERDRNRDGRPDETRYYVKGKLSRVQRDTNYDGRPDVWEVYADGQLERMGTDIDFDGHVDRWDRDEVAHRVAEEKERQDDEKTEAAQKAQEDANKAAGGPPGAATKPTRPQETGTKPGTAPASTTAGAGALPAPPTPPAPASGTSAPSGSGAPATTTPAKPPSTTPKKTP